MSGDDQRMSDYMDGRLSPAEKAAFEADLLTDPFLARRWRLMRATKAALIASAPLMPADLKDALKYQARGRDRARVRRPSWMDVLRESLAARPWAYGAGAAFAAAGLTVVLRLASAPGPVPAPVARVEPRPVESVASAAPPLAELWTDDDGGDEDEG